MKSSKTWMISAFAIAAVAALAFKPAPVSGNAFDSLRYKPIGPGNCPQVTCKAVGTTSCNGFYQNDNCTTPITDDLSYTP